MIIINENKIYTFGILIPEKVCIRTIHDTRAGELTDDKTKIKVWLSYAAFLKSKFDVTGVNSQNLIIDNLPTSEIIEIPQDEQISNISTPKDIEKYYNIKHVQILKTTLNLTDDDIEII